MPLLVESESFKAAPGKIETVQELHPTGAGKLDEKEWVS